MAPSKLTSFENVHFGQDDISGLRRIGRKTVIFMPPFRKGVYSNTKECSPFLKGSFSFRIGKSLPFEVGPFTDRAWCAENQAESHKSCFLVQYGGNSTKNNTLYPIGYVPFVLAGIITLLFHLQVQDSGKI